MTPGFPPIAIVLSGLSMVADSAQLLLSIGGLGALLFGLFKYRELVGKCVIFLLRKVTHKRR